MTLQRAADHPGSAGKVAPLCQIRSWMKRIGMSRGHTGEILVRGPVVFQGYFDQPDVTAQTFRGGWHHTGDVGRFDADGYLYYVQRKPEKALIKPGVKTSIQQRWKRSSWSWRRHWCLCVRRARRPMGEAIKAVVEVPAAQGLTAAAVSEYVGSRIARYKRPRWVEFTTSLPRNTVGMVDRDAVQSPVGKNSQG